MAIPATTPRLTADDLLQMPDDGHRYELDCGELVQLPMSSFNSSRIAVRISSAMYAFVNARGLGYIAGVDGAYILKRDPDVVRVPDVSFVRAERMPPEEQWSRFLDLAPDLAVEVISPSDILYAMPPWSQYAPADWERPQNPIMSDIVALFYPMYYEVARSLERG